MREAAKHMDALSRALLHAADGQLGRTRARRRSSPRTSGSSTLARTLRMDRVITKHSAIMDKYDPEKRVGLLVDEWGTWYDAEPGHEPGLPVPAEHAARRAGRGASISTSSIAMPTGCA